MLRNNITSLPALHDVGSHAVLGFWRGFDRNGVNFILLFTHYKVDSNSFATCSKTGKSETRLPILYLTYLREYYMKVSKCHGETLKRENISG